MNKLVTKRYAVRNYLEQVTILGLLSAFILPPIMLFGYGLYLVTIVSPIVFLLFLSLFRGKIYLSGGIIVVTGICLSALISVIYSYEILAVPYNTSDLLEIVKFMQFIPYLLAIQFLDGRSFDNRCYLYITRASVIFVLIGLIQILNINPFALILNNLYGSAAQQLAYQPGGRIFITGSDPNTGGSIALFFAAFNCFAYVGTKKLKHAILAGMTLLLILMAQSRTVLFGLIVATLLYGALFSKSTLLARLSAIVLIVSLLIFSIYYFNLEYVIIGLRTAESGHNNSLNVRLKNIETAFQFFGQSPIFGWGPAKAIHPTVIDSEYALILERYGILGILAFASYMKHQFKISFESMNLSNARWLFGSLSVFYVIFSITIMTTNNVFSGYQLMSILILLLCVVTAKWRSIVSHVIV
jgi:hypothetical protein